MLDRFKSPTPVHFNPATRTHLFAPWWLWIAIVLAHFAFLWKAHAWSLEQDLEQTNPPSGVYQVIARTIYEPEPATQKPLPKPQVVNTKEQAPQDETTPAESDESVNNQLQSSTEQVAIAPAVPDSPASEIKAQATEQPTPEPTPASVAQAADDQRLQITWKFPRSAKLQYQVKGQKHGLTYYASSSLDWQHDQKTYALKLVIKALFLGERTRESTGNLSTYGLTPIRFSDKSGTELATHFDYSSNTLVFSANTPNLALKSGGQDQLSLFIQLAAYYLSAPEKPKAYSSLLWQVAGPKDAEDWLLNIEPAESLTLPYGTVNAIKITRHPRQPYDKYLELWLAPDLDFLPVRIKLVDANGDFVDQQLETLESP